ncbi:hypothetical protein HanIR_Chr16g0835191 [Helianthus annuus]|nr:hypothetical protein HanIR_Chr16g0835191 [Helianthus annuus]
MMERRRERKAKGRPSRKPKGLQSPSPQHIFACSVDRFRSKAKSRFKLRYAISLLFFLLFFFLIMKTVPQLFVGFQVLVRVSYA